MAQQGEEEAVRESETVTAFLLASRALVAVAARSVNQIGHDLTLRQYRALVVLASRGPRNVTALGDEIGVHQATASRLVARLTREGLIERQTNEHNRREVHLNVSPAGRGLLAEVHRRREEEIATILHRMTAGDRAAALHALRAFSDAAGEQSELLWPWDGAG